MADIIEAELAEPEPRSWGFWATVGFSLAVFFTLVVIQTAITVAFVLAAAVQGGGGKAFAPERLMDRTEIEELESNGLLLSLATCASAPVCLGLTILFAWLRKTMPVAHYLGLRRVAWGRLGLWLAVFLAMMATSEAINYSLDRLMPDFMVRAYQTAGFVPLLWLAIVVVGPVFEELFFRGFVFRGIQASRLGSAGAIFLTAIPWAVIHFQYDAYTVVVIFLFGLLLGLARDRTGSVVPPLVMHVTMNLAATIEVAIYLAAK